MKKEEPFSRYVVIFILCVLFVISIIVWNLVILSFDSPKLKVSFMDVGQGDSILLTSPSGIRVLVDGGPGSSVLTKLSKEIPWYDKRVDVIVATHPDADHISGLIDVLDRYYVSMVIESSVLGDTEVWNKLQEAIEDEGAEKVMAIRGQIFNLGSGAYLEILFPDRELISAETNLASVVLKAVYGDTSFILSGDSPQQIEEYLVYLDRESLNSNVLKAGHHGSKTSTSPLFLGYVDPESVIFSRGCSNRYGHPSRETLEVLNKFGEQIYDTCEDGTIRFESDGVKVVHK